MKIIPTEPESQPMTASIIRFVGYIQFFVVAFIVNALVSRILSPLLSLIVSIVAGMVVSIVAFVLSRILTDLHAIRVNTNGFETEYEREDYRLLVQAMRQMNDNLARIQEMLYTLHPDAFEYMNENNESDDMDPDRMFMIDQEERDKEILEEINEL